MIFMNNTATTTVHTLCVGETVLFADPDCDETARCGTVTRVLRSRALGSLEANVTVEVECSNGDRFHGAEHEFNRVRRFNG